MSTALAALLASLERLKAQIKAVRGDQVQASDIKGQMHQIASEFFAQAKPALIAGGADPQALEAADGLFRELLHASRRRASKDKCLTLVKNARAALIAVESHLIARPVAANTLATPADTRIIETLDELCPSAACSYQQAIADLQSDGRLSWRGPAADLREALRETLDTLAPDDDVMRATGFKLEQDAKRPTMKQKARFILRSRGFGSGQLSVPETAIEGIEDMVGGVVRSVYTRSSLSTHVATNKDEVLRVMAWTRLVMCELLEVPL